jgi:hypothetical protein
MAARFFDEMLEGREDGATEAIEAGQALPSGRSGPTTGTLPNGWGGSPRRR